MKPSGLYPRPLILLTTLCFVFAPGAWGQANDARGQASGSDGVANYRPVTLTFNFLGLAETGPAVGLGAGYQWNRHWQVWAEGSVLLHDWNQPGNTSDYDLRQGFRAELALKYYFGEGNNWFVGGEVRLKQTLYRRNGEIINSTTHDTLRHFTNDARNLLPGFAMLAGGRSGPFWRHHFWVEYNIGIGLKYRNVQVIGIPPGYRRFDVGVDHLNPTTIDPTQPGWLIYVPATVRLVYGF